METNTPTIFKSLLQTSMMLNLPFNYPAYSTLNEKLAIGSPTPSLSTYPVMKYVVLGNGGLTVSTGTDGIPFTTSYNHIPTDTGLFSEFPFVVRAVGNDLDSGTRAKYRLRRQITVGSNNYIAYYGKVMDFTGVTNTLQTRTVDSTNGNVSSTPWAPTSSNLSPIPTVLNPGQTVTTTTNYLVASAPVLFVLNANDVLELINASNLIYGDEDHAVISEVALCAGVDASFTASDSTTYTEALGMQVMSFLSTNFPAPAWSQGVQFNFDIGNAEPLF